MYYLNFYNGELISIVQPLNDGNVLMHPIAEDNSGYRDYLAWLAEGNTPEPWQPEEPAG